MSLSVTLLGTGCPVAHPDRRGAAQLIAADDVRLLVDCGSGVAQQLVGAGVRGADIDALLITHYHSDHLVDFYQLVMSSWHQGRDRPWQIHAPAPVIAHIEKQMAAWKDERDLRIAFEDRPNGTAAFDLSFHELAPGPIGMWSGLDVEALAVDHAPVEPAYGFTFRHADTTIVFSGDTRPCPAIEDAARGADLLLHEVFIHTQMPPTAGQRTARTVETIASYHSIPTSVAQLAARARPKALALTHFVPPVFEAAQLLDEMAAHFSGPIIVGADLMRIDATNRSVTSDGVVIRY